MSIDCKDKYPLVTVRALERIDDLSDHVPLLLSTGILKPNARHRFKFELGWLLRDGFDDMVKRVWSAPVPGNSPVRRWNAKIRNLRKYLRGWARHTTGILKKEKERLSTIIDELDRAAETRVLTQQEIELKSQSNAEVARMLQEEKLRWYQRSKSNFILKGDVNTKYF